MQKIVEWGGLWTTSIPINNNPNLWNILSHNCSTNFWRAAINEDGWITSCHTIESVRSHNLTHQHILSNGFHAEVENSNQETENGINTDIINICHRYRIYNNSTL